MVKFFTKLSTRVCNEEAQECASARMYKVTAVVRGWFEIHIYE